MANTKHYLTTPLSSFDSRLDINEIPSGMPIAPGRMSEEIALFDYIDSLTANDFLNASSSINKDRKDNDGFQFIVSQSSEGVRYQVISNFLFNCVASSIVGTGENPNSWNADLLAEVKSALEQSSQTGISYLITEDVPETVSSKPVLLASNLELVKNISFLGRVVDIVKLDPLNILNTISNISAIDFSFSEATAIPSSDGRYGIPPATKLLPKPSLDVSVDTSVFEERTSFSESFSSTLTINVPVPPAIGLPTVLGFTENETVNDRNAPQREIVVTRKPLFSSYTPKLEDIVRRYKRDAKILINKITFLNLWRTQPKSQILTEGEVRLDLQGLDNKNFNYQIQVGGHTISTALIERGIADISRQSEQVYAIRKIKSAFQQSLDDSHIYQVSFRSGFGANLLTLSSEDETPAVLGSFDFLDKDADHPHFDDASLASGSAFSLSATFSFVTRNTRELKNTVTCSTASHSLYLLQIDKTATPKQLKLDPEFIQWVEKIDPDKPDSIDAFIFQVGTHYTTGVTYGGLGFQVLKMTSDQVEQLKEDGVTVSAAASDSLLQGSVTNKTESGYSSYTGKSSSKTVFLGGTVLPSMHDNKLDFKEWSESVPKEPIPLQVSVSLLSELMIPDFFPNIDSNLLSRKRSMVEEFTKLYLYGHQSPVPAPGAEFTSGVYSRSSYFMLQVADAPLIVSNPYVGQRGFMPYLFPTLKEQSNPPLVLYFRIGDNDNVQKMLNNTFCSICSLFTNRGAFGAQFMDYDTISFYSGFPQAYLDDGSNLDDCGFEIEKLSADDPVIRDGDRVRFKHTSSDQYLATFSNKDGRQTLTRTPEKNSSVFIIKRVSVN
ncbi:MAC/Perforin domain protein [Chlamydia ibidis]|uniref:MAC/Perforin domain protein n=2 Tax=Chlamydia ibidis TaxID=1405396 RepID=S7KGK9_9CHLA|nr:MAC/perforin domain-containing protein [Chlamydia ibidis]EPP35291.1 MAC/Perforin domain protein [Chlamydia ibidis]EQM62711.1 MAC/Perforin domain protein [Chlamydia ibidis 10-1398/6]